MRRLTAIAFLTLITVLSGCASVSPRTSGTALPADLHDLDRWQARGRLGISSGDGGGSGSFVWEQQDDRADVQIRGPVGIGSVRLQLRGDAANPRVRLETGRGEALEAQAAWDELEARLGAAVPAGHMRYWMLGLAAPGEHRWLAPKPDGSTALEQDGWHIDYQSFSTDPGARVPMRIRASSGDARVRIVVDKWQLGAPAK